MNERIRKLAFQAMSINQKVSDDAFFVEVSKLNEFEKFAELIVQECVIRAEREWIRNGSDTEHNKAITGVIKSIKEHFGVEE